jgi:hypothetical protein
LCGACWLPSWARRQPRAVRGALVGEGAQEAGGDGPLVRSGSWSCDRGRHSLPGATRHDQFHRAADVGGTGGALGICGRRHEFHGFALFFVQAIDLIPDGSI